MRNIFILSLSQALGTAGVTLVAFTGGIIGGELAPSPIWATLPIAILVLGNASFTIPASLVARRWGRRVGFVAGSLMAMSAAVCAAWAINAQSFFVFCAAVALIGGNGAFMQQYRFAAVESTSPRRASRAVSLVLLGGVAAGFLGPEIAERTQDWLPYRMFTGSFLSLAVLYAGVAGSLAFLRNTHPTGVETIEEERPLRAVIAQPGYRVAVLAGIVAFGVMSFIMTATPISMHVIDGHALSSTALVIQSHVMAMYLPSLFSGYLIERLGVVPVMLAGVFCLGGCVLIAGLGQEVVNYWFSLVLLGLGWNLLFVSATILVTHTYRPSERFKAQAINDFSVFGTQALVSLSAGTVIHMAGWRTLVLLNLPVLAVLLFAVRSLHRQEAPERTLA